MRMGKGRKIDSIPSTKLKYLISYISSTFTLESAGMNVFTI